MATRPARRRAQRGLALLGLLAVIVMVFAWILTSRLNAANQYVALDRERNAKVMSRAKAALIGYVAQQAAMAGENNPGSMPCPEAPGNFGVAAQEGIAAGNCTLPAVGRLPWRTLGVERLVDAAGEPLWYVVSPGWAMPNSTTNTVINADSTGQLTVDGATNDAVALIIAPGPAIAVQTSAGCTAWSQARPSTGAPDKRNYLECGNATNTFVSSSANAGFNDQILRVTTAHVMPALEAAIQVRAQREIAPAVRSAAFELDTNSPRQWISTAILSTSPPPIYPYPVPFTTPTTSQSNYRGTEGTNQGLMPFARVADSVTFQPTPPANVIKTTSNGKVANIVCGWEVTDVVFTCTGDYEKQDATLPISVEMTATFANVAMGLRARNTAALTAEARDDDGVSPWSTSNVATSKLLEMNDGGTGPRGSLTTTLSVTLPNHQTMGWGKWAEFRLRMSRAVVADHPLLSDTGRALRFSGGGFTAINNGNTVTGATSGASGAVQVVVNSGTWSGGNAAGVLFFSSVSGTFVNGEALQVSGSTRATSSGADYDIGWFVRNEWFRNVYYAVAGQNIPDTLPSVTDCDSSNCLRFNDSGIRNTRVLLVLAGQRLAGQARPSSNFANYLEFQNADNGTFYEQRRPRADRVVDATLNAPWNDRLVIVDWITPKPVFPLAYVQ